MNNQEGRPVVRLISIVLLAMAGLLALGVVLGGSRPAAAGYAPDTDVAGHITGNTTWTLANSPYIVTDDVIVDPGVTLTIEAGVVVKFTDYFDDLFVDGTLIAGGTAGSPIYFTSINDHTVGGATGTGTPAGEDWSSIRFISGSSGSLLDHVVVRYGGGASNENIYIQTRSITLTNSTIGPSSWDGVRLSNSLPPRLENNAFISNTNYAVYSTLDANGDSIVVSNNSASGNGINGLRVAGTVGGQAVWDGDDGFPFVIDNDLTIAASAQLTLTPGTVVKMFDYFDDLHVDGTLVAQGTAGQPIRFTSLKDDTAGGDTNDDGSATSPTPDDWSSIRFNTTSSGSILDYVEVGYGGGSSNENIAVGTNDIRVSNSTVFSSTVYGVRLNNHIPEFFQDNTFLDNGGYAVYASLVNNTDDVTLVGNSAAGNGTNGIRVGGQVSGSVTWDGDTGLPFVVDDDLIVRPNSSLTLMPGTLVKMATYYDELYVDGALIAQGTPGYPIHITSIRDDSVGGDTNDDGAASAPAPGDWSSIRVNGGSSGTELSYVEVGFGGGFYGENIYAATNAISITNSSIYSSAVHGIYFSNKMPAVLQDNTFSDNTSYAVYAQMADNADDLVLSGNAASGNGVNGLRVGVSVSGTVTWDGDSGLPFVINDDLTIRPDSQLTLTPGTIVKMFDYFDELYVDGALLAQGTAVDPIHVTSIRDDSVGGDTNGDGNSTTPAGDDWSALRFNSAGSGSVLEYLNVGYGGGFHSQNIYVATNAISISHSTIHDSFEHGVYLDNHAPALFQDNNLDGNLGYAVYATLPDSDIDLRLSGNSASNNGKNGLRVAGQISGTATWDGDPGLPFVVDGDLTIKPGSHLTLTAGTVVKMFDYFDEIFVDGALDARGTESQPIHITSVRDDSVGGDTNNDGAATSPAALDWSSLRFSAGSVGSVLDYVKLRYAGGNFSEAIYLNTADISLSNSTIEHVNPYGLTIDGVAPLIAGNVFRHNPHGIRVANDARPVLRNNEIYSNTTYGVSNATPTTAVDARDNWWGDVSGPQHAGVNPAGQGDAVSNGVLFAPWHGAFALLEPLSELVHGQQIISWKQYDAAAGTVTVTVDVRPVDGWWSTLAAEQPATGDYAWDTSGLADGSYEVRATFAGQGGVVLAEHKKLVLVLNDPSLMWHGGRLTSDESWAAGKLHLVEGNLSVAAGVTLTVEAGAVIKAADGVQISLVDGAVLDAQGTAPEPIIFTSLKDDEAWGDTNLDGDLTRPLAGDWSGVAVQGSATFLSSEDTFLRYYLVRHSGTLAGNETWQSGTAHIVEANVTVPAGLTLTVEAGAVVKFEQMTGLTVANGGTLLAEGSVAQPAVFTSIHDDAYGGDSDRNGDHRGPEPGDWLSLYVNGGSATLDHVVLAYSGGSTASYWSNSGALRTAGNSQVSMRNSHLRDAFYDGVLAQGGVTLIENSLITNADRGVVAWGGGAVVTVTNSSLTDNQKGALAHGGTLAIMNSLLAHNGVVCLERDIDPIPAVFFSDLYCPDAADGHFKGIPDPIGSDGNVSVDPAFRDWTGGDYRLQYASPVIDAADGERAPETDYSGAPRYDDPRTVNSGIATPSGAFADMGAFEFVETAESDLDLVASAVSGPVSGLAGDTVEVAWTVTNISAGTVSGPWHDAIYLAKQGGGAADELTAGEVLVGQGQTLGPGQSARFSGEVRIPGGLPGDYSWGVSTNSRAEVFEGQNSDNNRATGTTLALDLPQLTVDGAPASGFFESPGQAHWFKFTPPAGQDIAVDLALAGGGGSVELYLARQSMPSRQEYEARFLEWGAGEVSAVVADTTAETYYILAYAKSLDAPDMGFSIAATTLGFSVLEVAPEVVGDTGPVTLRVRGGGFGPGTTFKLADPDTGMFITPTQAILLNSAFVDVTFDTSGLDPAVYDLQAIDGQSVTLIDAVVVQAGTGGEFWAALSGRSIIRAGRAQRYELQYGNRGDGDVLGAVIFIQGLPLNAQVELGPDFEVTPLPAPLDGPRPAVAASGNTLVVTPLAAPNLPPGATGSALFTITIPTQSAFELSLASFVPPGPPAADPAPDPTAGAETGYDIASTAAYQWPDEDLEGLEFAHNIAWEYWGRGNFARWATNEACVGEAAYMKKILEQASNNHPQRPLNGWTLKRITKNGYIGLGHTTVLMCSPRGKCYIVDNYVFPTVIPVERFGPDKYAIHSDFHLSTNPFTNFEKTLTLTGGGLLWDTFDYESEFVTIWSPRPTPPTAVTSAGSRDPNEKVGSHGSSENEFIYGDETLTYQVFFENVMTATLPAQRVIITDVLDANLDLSTFELAGMHFNQVDVAVPSGLDHFEGQATVATDPYPVRVTAELDPDSRIISWVLESVDGLSGGQPEDPLAGFLPPNDDQGRGEGYVSFSIRPLPGLAEGVDISNEARIIFDTNEPIDTNAVIYTLDQTAPSSQVSPLPATTDVLSFTVSWSGLDPSGDGYLYYDVYVVDDGKTDLWIGGVTATEGLYPGEVDHTYGFYTVAVDRAGNREAAPAEVDATITVIEGRYQVFLPTVVRE